MIEIHLDGKPVTKLQAARAVAIVGGEHVDIGKPDAAGWIQDGIALGARSALGEIRRPELGCGSFRADNPAEMRQQAEMITLAAEIADLAEMIAAEQEADKPKPVVWQCMYCWTEYEAMPSEQPPVCPECGPLHGPGAPDAQPRIKPEPAAAKAPASLVGRLVEDAHDDSPVPVTGKVVRQVDENTVEVLWGDLKFWPNPGHGSREPINSLRPAREQAGA